MHEDESLDELLSQEDMKYSSLLLQISKHIGCEIPARPTEHNCDLPLYQPLTEHSLTFPYADLLLQLQKKVGNKISKADPLNELSLKKILSDMAYEDHCNAASEASDVHIQNDCSKKLHNFIVFETIKTAIGNNDREKLSSSREKPGLSIGKVLSTINHEMPLSSCDVPLSDFHYSTLLLRARKTYLQEQGLQTSCSSSCAGRDEFYSEQKRRKSTRQWRKLTASKSCISAESPTLLKLLLKTNAETHQEAKDNSVNSDVDILIENSNPYASNDFSDQTMYYSDNDYESSLKNITAATRKTVPGLIPCSLLGHSKLPSDCVHNKNYKMAGENGQKMSLSVASLLYDLQFPPTSDLRLSDESDSFKSQSVISEETSAASSVARKKLKCMQCNVPFGNLLQLQCHQSIFHSIPSLNFTEKLRN